VSNIRLAVVVIPGHAAETRKRAPAGAPAFLRKPPDGEPLLDAVTHRIAHIRLKPASLQNKAPLE